jgi:lysophospholipase L1-like esterase
MRRLPTAVPAAALVALAAAALPPAAGAAPRCSATHWVGAWSAPPSDASRGTGIGDRLDPSLNVKTPARDDTTRAILTPTLGGSTLRVRLSNRFGAGPVTFAHVTVARRQGGAALVAGTVREVTFHGRRSVTVRAGRDVISDAVRLPFRAAQTLAVDVHVAGDAGKPTEHFAARQTSYLTPDGSGDHAGEVSGASFTERTTGRPFVTGIDVKASRRTGAVVALGDSLTDGYDGSPIGVPETRDGVDANGRYTDVLARRLRSAGRRLSVLNMGITGNRVLSNAGGNFGPSALSRLSADVLRQSGVTTVIWLEGLNDIGQTPSAGVPDLITGWKRGIARMHRAGLRVLLGTLPPTGSADIREDALENKRQRLNQWIRTAKTADGVIDVDAALRDKALPNRVAPAYSGTDRLHLNLAGNRALGNAVPLRKLRLPSCRRR